MEAVILIGLPGAGKTTFYEQRLAHSHARVSLDQLKTRPREMAALQNLLQQKRPFAVDNTNVTRAERQRFLAASRAAGFRTVGYFFEPDIPGCLKRNAARTGKARIPLPGLFGTKKRLQVPTMDEGFEQLFSVRIGEGGAFVVEPGVRAAEGPDPETEPKITQPTQAPRNGATRPYHFQNGKSPDDPI